MAGPPRWTIAAVGFEPSSENGTFDIHCTPRPEPASFSDATLRMRGGATSGHWPHDRPIPFDNDAKDI